MGQGIAAAQAGVSVIQVNVGRIQDWYNNHPGVIRDPQVKLIDWQLSFNWLECYLMCWKLSRVNRQYADIRVLQGPREDSGFSSSVIPGQRLVTDLYNYVKQHHSSTQVMVSGVRTKEGTMCLLVNQYYLLLHWCCWSQITCSMACSPEELVPRCAFHGGMWLPNFGAKSTYSPQQHTNCTGIQWWSIWNNIWKRYFKKVVSCSIFGECTKGVPRTRKGRIHGLFGRCRDWASWSGLKSNFSFVAALFFMLECPYL